MEPAPSPSRGTAWRRRQQARRAQWRREAQTRCLFGALFHHTTNADGPHCDGPVDTTVRAHTGFQELARITKLVSSLEHKVQHLASQLSELASAHPARTVPGYSASSSALPHGGISDSSLWHSSDIPFSIRRPWQVLEEELGDDSDADSSSRDPETQERRTAVQKHGAQRVFEELPRESKREYMQVSIEELAAYSAWQAVQLSVLPVCDSSDLHSAWDALDSDGKAGWIPADPRSQLETDPRWDALLREVTAYDDSPLPSPPASPCTPTSRRGYPAWSCNYGYWTSNPSWSYGYG